MDFPFFIFCVAYLVADMELVEFSQAMDGLSPNFQDIVTTKGLAVYYDLSGIWQ